MDSLLGDASLHTFGDSDAPVTLQQSIQATQDVLMSGGKVPVSAEAAARNVTLHPECATPWDFFNGRWVRSAPLDGMFDVNVSTGRPPWRPLAEALHNQAHYFYNNGVCGLVRQ